MDANGLRTEVKSLIGGGHNEDFKLFYDIVNKNGKDGAASVLGQLGSEVTGRIPIIKSTGDKWGDRGIVAWDLLRVGTLVSWGYAAGYVDMEEACLLMEPAVSLLKKNFSNWDDAAANYLDGYCYWANVDPTKDGTTYTERKKIYTNLKKSRSDLFKDSLFSNLPVVGLKKTAAPTPELLNGYWSCEYKEDPYKGTLVQYYFDKNGNAACYIEFLGQQIYSKGSYSIKNGILSITYNYIDDGENQIQLTGDEIKKKWIHIAFL